MAGYRDTPNGRAEDALCDLNMAAAVQSLCENSLFRTSAGHRFESRIVKLCKEHMQLQLRAYDRAKGSTDANQ